MENKGKIAQTRYVLAVQNLHQSVEFYKEILDFETTWEGDGWHFLQRDACFIMLGECADSPSASEIHDHSYFAYLEIEGIDKLYSDLAKKNIEIISPIENKNWGQREFGIRTIDGHRIMFGQAI